MMIRFLTALALASVLVLAGCSEDSPSSPSGDPENSFRVNGSGYNDVLVEANVGPQSTLANETDDIGSVLLIGVNGEDVFSATVTILDIKTGEFAISQTEGVGFSVGVVKDSRSSFYFGKSGTINVTTWDGPGGTAKGTFTATCVLTPGTDEITVTGKFNVSPILNE